MFLLTILSVAVSVGIIAHLFRFNLREQYHELRKRQIGGLAWYKITPEGRAGSDLGNYDISNMTYLKSLLQSLTVTFGSTWYLRRGMVQCVWAKNPRTGAVDFFLGVSNAHDRDGHVANQVAHGMGGSAKRLKKAPNFPHRAPMILWRQATKFGNVNSNNEVSGRGHVSKNLSAAWSSLASGESSAVFMSMEQVRNKEGNKLRAFITGSAVQEAGEFASAPSLADKSAIVSEGFRVSIATANTQGSYPLSRASLNETDGALSTSGWKVAATMPNEKQIHVAFSVAIPTTFLMMLMSWILIGSPLAYVVSALPLIAAGIHASMTTSLSRSVFERTLSHGELPLPPYVSVNPLRFVLGNISAGKTIGGDTNKVSHDRIAIPSCKQVLYLHFGAAFEFLSFPERDDIDTDIDSQRTQELGLPASMQDFEDEVLYFGQSGKDQAITYPVKNLVYSLYASGAPSSGKSNFLQSIYMGCCYYTDPLGRKSSYQVTPVWCETKGEGAYDVVRSVLKAGIKDVMFIDFNNPRSGYKFNLTGRQWMDGASLEEIATSCTDFVTGIQAAWGDSVRGASRDAMYGYLLIAMLLTPYEIKYLGLDEVIDVDDINVIELAYYLTGSDSSFMQPGDGKIITLQQELLDGALELPADKRDSTDERDMYLARAIGSFSNRLFTPQGIRTNASVISSVQNKLNDLRKLSVIWTKSKNPKCKTVTFKDMIGSGKPIIINMGGYATGRNDEGSLIFRSIDQSLARRVVNIYNYLQWNYIRQNCNGWQKAKRLTPVFFDEAADIAQSADSEDVPDVVQQCVKEGRSYGNAYLLGAQSLTQMPIKTQSMVLGFRSKFWFNSHSTSDLEVAAKDLNSSSSINKAQISETNIRYQRNGTAMGILMIGDSLTPPITLHAPMLDHWTESLFDSSVTSVKDAIALFQSRYGEEIMTGRVGGQSDDMVLEVDS